MFSILNPLAMETFTHNILCWGCRSKVCYCVGSQTSQLISPQNGLFLTTWASVRYLFPMDSTPIEIVVFKILLLDLRSVLHHSRSRPRLSRHTAAHGFRWSCRRFWSPRKIERNNCRQRKSTLQRHQVNYSLLLLIFQVRTSMTCSALKIILFHKLPASFLSLLSHF